MQASAQFFGSLQALDSKNQRKKVVCRLLPPLLVGAEAVVSKGRGN